MTKNLYRLHAPLHNAYDGERPNRDRSYVELVPPGYQEAGSIERVLDDGTKLTYHITSNEGLFWRSPAE